jgi:hypothetical protein
MSSLIRGIVRKQNKSLMLCNNDMGDYEEDENSLKDNLGFYHAFQLDTQELKELAETGTTETGSGFKLVKYAVVTDPRLKTAIDRTRGTSILGYGVSRHDDHTLSFGCGNVILDRSQLEALLRIKKAHKPEDVRLFVELVGDIEGNVDSYDIAKVTPAEIEELLRMIPATKPTKKRKR